MRSSLPAPRLVHTPWARVHRAIRCGFGHDISVGALAWFGRRGLRLCEIHAVHYALVPPAEMVADPKRRQLPECDR